MKASSRMLAAMVGAGFFTVPVATWAGWPSGALESLHAAVVVGQAASKPAASSDSRREVADLLKRAREEMSEGHYETADSLISRAERMKAPFGFLPRGDTPKKARRDLEKARGGAGVKRPSQLFAPPEQDRGDASQSAGDSATAPSDQPPATNDPFAVRPAPFEPRMDRPSEADRLDPRYGDAPPDEHDPDASMPRQAFPTESPFGRDLPEEPPSDEDARAGVERVIERAGPLSVPKDSARAESDKLLLAARRALAVGDIRQAGAKLNAVKAMRLKYEFNEDAPEKIEGLLQRWSELNRQGVNRESETYRRGQSDFLLEQAEALILWRELDEAERLVADAKRLNVPYGPLDAKPDTLLDRIAAARQGRQSGVERLPAIDGTDATAETLAGADRPFDPDLARKTDALRLVAQARSAIAAGEYDRAQALAERAENLRVPDAAFSPRDDRPWLVINDLEKLRESGVAPANHVAPIGADADTAPAQRAVYDQNNDPTRNMPAGAQTGVEENGMLLYQRGEEALRAHDSATALHWFRQANQHRDELDQPTLRRLQDRLQLLAQPHAEHPQGEDGSLLHDTLAAQQLKGRQLTTELTRKEQAADRLKTDDPKQALATLNECRTLVEKADVDDRTRGILLRRVDRKIEELEHFLTENRGRIELNEKNEAVRKQIAREQQARIEGREKIAELVDKFNTYMREERWAEAEVVYKQAAAIAPDDLVVVQLKNTLKMLQRTKTVAARRDRVEQGVFDALEAVEDSLVPMDDRKPIQFGPVKDWEKLTKRRKELLSEMNNRRSERDIEIENRLRLPVSANFRDAPLTDVISNLGKVTGINVYIDSSGLAEEGVDPMAPVTLDLTRQISMKSALNLVLSPLHLSYVIKDEVLKITSEQLRDGEVVVKTYNVADLVTPIPNFVPNANSALAGALHNAQANLPMNWGGLNGDGAANSLSVNSDAGGNAVLDPRMLAQMNSATGGAISTSPGGPGPGGLSGGVQADFESLIELITSTIAPTTWDDVGGPGTVTQFQSNLSLVISQTQEVHEEIADLLEQLRRLQDLQVTVEVRFITLNDNYFERIGVNFDFEIPTNVNKPFQLFGDSVGDPTRTINTGATVAFPPPSPGNQNVTPINLRKQNGVTVGLSPGQTGSVLYSSDLDIPFTQGSFGLATPQFGDYQPGAGATLGFAILSNIEAYLLVEGSQGDRRSNVLQAPKVTLFNGQSAIVADQTATPFVMSVIPVVGAFAAAQQPVIVVLNEGTALNVQAVVSSDRRFVRLTLIPFFSNISQVNTFTFTGSSSTTTNSDSEGPSDNSTKRQTSSTTASQGTTVQLPSFSFFTVSTTVSVPDGGTVLLGGVKRLSEGRNEFGVPVLSKIPYVNRLFRNVGIGRETQSLMMMVTPRIIIQEEEEALLGIPATP